MDRVVKAADRINRVPVLVAYNLPFRDCAQYSAGGATALLRLKRGSTGSPRGSVTAKPWSSWNLTASGSSPGTNLDGALEWCQPPEGNPATAAAERYEQLNYAVDALSANPGTSVYLDRPTAPGSTLARSPTACSRLASNALPASSSTRPITSSPPTWRSTAPGSPRASRT